MKPSEFNLIGGEQVEEKEIHCDCGNYHKTSLACSEIFKGKDENWEQKYNNLQSRMRAIKKSLSELEKEAEGKGLPFIHRTNPLYKGLLRLSRD